MNLSRVYPYACAMLVLVSLLLGLGHLTAGHNWGGDFAQYIMQAQSIVNGSISTFMESNRWTMEQSYHPVGPVAYPWGLPLLLAPLYAWLGVSLTAFKLVGVASFILFLIVYARYVWRDHAPLTSLLLVAAFAFNPALLSFLNQITSDIPFLLVSTASVLLLTRPAGSPPSKGRSLLTGLMIGSACLLRTNGILLILPLAISQLGACLSATPLRINLRALFTLSNVFAWMGLIGLVGGSALFFPEGGSSHLGLLDQVSGQTIKNNIVYYFKLPLAFYEGVPGRAVICLLTFPLALVGGLSRMRTDYPVILYLLATLGLYIIWPDAMQGLRFLFPVLPFYLSFSVIGYFVLTGYLPSSVRKAALAVGLGLAMYVVGALAVTSAVRVAANQCQDRPAPEGPYTEVSRAMFDEVRRVTAPDDQVVFFKPRVARFLTGRPSMLQRSLDNLRPGTYIVLYQDDDGSVWPISKAEIAAAIQTQRVLCISAAARYGIYIYGGNGDCGKGANQQ